MRGAPRDRVRVPCSIARMRSTMAERVMAEVTSLLLRIIASDCMHHCSQIVGILVVLDIKTLSKTPLIFCMQK